MGMIGNGSGSGVPFLAVDSKLVQAIHDGAALRASDGGIGALLRGISAERDVAEAGEHIPATVLETEGASARQQLFEVAAAFVDFLLLGEQIAAGLPFLAGQAVGSQRSTAAKKRPMSSMRVATNSWPEGPADSISIPPAPVGRNDAPAGALHGLKAGDGEDGEHDGEPHASAGKARERDRGTDNRGYDERFPAAIVTVPLFEEGAHDVTAVEWPNRQEVHQAPVEIHEEEIVNDYDCVGIERHAVRPEQHPIIEHGGEVREEQCAG